MSPFVVLACPMYRFRVAPPYVVELLLALVVLCFARRHWLDHRPKPRAALHTVAITCAAIVQLGMLALLVGDMGWAEIKTSVRVVIWATMGLALCLFVEVLADDRNDRVPPARVHLSWARCLLSPLACHIGRAKLALLRGQGDRAPT